MPRKGNAYLLIDSLDRYLTTGANLGTENNPLVAQFLNTQDNTCADFSIQSPGALINGYMGSLTVTQIQLNYKIPTITPRNDTLFVYNYTTEEDAEITLPDGFYTPLEMAAVLQREFRQSGLLGDDFRVELLSDPVPDNGTLTGTLVPFDDEAYAFNTIDPAGNPISDSVQLGTVSYNINLTQNTVEYQIQGFRFTCVRGDTWSFTNPLIVGAAYPDSVIENMLRTYKTLGINVNMTEEAQPGGYPLNVKVSGTPNFLYTPYIDIQSFALTQYQKIKDTDTSAAKRSAIVARIYLSGVGQALVLTPDAGIGSAPFWLTADLNSPKVIEWSKDQNVANLDFKLFDCYGDPIFWDLARGYNTEFQMSLLVSE